MEFLAHLFSNDHFMNWSNQSKYFRASFTTWSTKSRSSSPATTGQVKLDVTCLHSQHTFCPRIVSFCIQSWMYCTTAESKFIDGFPVMDLKDWWTNKSRHVKLNWTGPNWVWPASILKGLFVQGLLASTFDHWHTLLLLSPDLQKGLSSWTWWRINGQTDLSLCRRDYEVEAWKPSGSWTTLQYC